MSERLDTIKAIQATLETITPTNGYLHDLSGRVFRGRMYFGQTDPLPMVSILEAPVPPEQAYGLFDNQGNAGTWELLVQGWVVDDKDHPTDPAYLLAEDVRRCLREAARKDGGMDPFGRGNHVRTVRVGPPIVRPPDEMSNKAYFWMHLYLEVVEI